MPKEKKSHSKPKAKFKPVKLATALGDAYKAGYIDGLKELSAQLTEADKILQWILKTKIHGLNNNRTEGLARKASS